MRTSTRLQWAIALVSLVLLPVAASAQAIATTYSYFYIAGQSAYTVYPDVTVNVPLYLEEVNSDQSTNSLLASESGLSAAGVSANLFSGSAANTIVGAAANIGPVPTGFDDPSSAGFVNSISSATITESTDPFPFGSDLVGVEAGPQIHGVSEVYLGSITIEGGALVGQESTFSVGDVSTSFGSTFTNNNGYDLDNNLDPLNPAGASSLYSSAAATLFSVTTIAVPEPASLSFLTCAGILLSLRFHRRGIPDQCK